MNHGKWSSNDKMQRLHEGYREFLTERAAPSWERVVGGTAALIKGMRGPAVAQLQQLLQMGELGGGKGRFGSQTMRAVKAFQKEHPETYHPKSRPDGIVGQKTAAVLSGARTQTKTSQVAAGPASSPLERDLTFLSSQLQTLSYINDEEMKAIHDVVKKYSRSPRLLQSFVAMYKNKTGDDLAQEIVDISGVERWKKPTVELFGQKYEKDFTTKVSAALGSAKEWLTDLFGGDGPEAAKELSNAAKKDAYLFYDGDNLNWVAGGQIVESWPATSGKVWFRHPGKRKQGEKSFGPIPDTKYRGGRPYGTGGLQEVKRNVGDPSLLKEMEYLIRQTLGDMGMGVKSAPHGWRTKKGKDVVFSQIAWGNFRVRIIGGASVDGTKRGSFYIHGGTLRGSSGCIDLGSAMPQFAKFWTVNTVRKNSGPPLYVEYSGDKLAELKSPATDTAVDAMARKKGKNLKTKPKKKPVA